MGVCRIFLSQEALDTWLGEQRAKVEGEELVDLKNNQKFRLVTGVRFLSEVSGLPDEAKLVGKVKDADQLAELKAEHLHDSVILGDNAYEVQEGFVGTPVAVEVAAAAKPAPRAAT